MKKIWWKGSPLLDILPQLPVTLDLIQILSMAYEALLNPGLDSLLDFILYQASFLLLSRYTCLLIVLHTHQSHSSFMEFALVLSIAEMPFAYLLGEILLDRFKCLLLWEILRPPIPKQSRDTQWPCPALKNFFFKLFSHGFIISSPSGECKLYEIRLAASWLYPRWYLVKTGTDSLLNKSPNE